MSKTPQKAILIDLIHPSLNAQDSLKRMEELEELVNTFGDIVVIKRHQKRFSPHPRTFVGTGKLDMLAEEGKEIGAKLLIINNQLKPRQMYAINEVLRPFKMKAWDRIDLILKIFDRHARTAEAKLEIELASIKHMGPRIFGMGMELLRQAGGIGTRGIGETNTEIMKRHLRARKISIEKKLEKYQKVRRGHQANRKRKGLKTVAIVGYTNAGKTTLLNALTGRKEYAADKLFATLDTRVGKLWLPTSKESVLISDTIGFIKDLPPELLNAFASTLSEAIEADVLLHVVDASDKDSQEHIVVVEEILERLGIMDVPRIIVCNKIDQIISSDREFLLETDCSIVNVSAIKSVGLSELKEAIEQKIKTPAK